MTIKIFKHKEGKLTEIEKVDEEQPWDFEKEIQTLVEQNVGTIFPELEFVDTEYILENFRIDSVCFNKETNSFVIIEYKKLKHGGAIDQGMAYLDLLEDNKDEFISLYNTKKGILLDTRDVNWDEAKVIIISPDYTQHQLRAAKRTREALEFWLIERYNDAITLRMLHEKVKPVKRKVERIGFTPTGGYSEEDYLDGKYFRNKTPNEDARRLFKKIKGRILETFPELEAKQKSKYMGFYSTKDGSTVCTVEITTKGLKVCYGTTKKDFLPKSDFIRYMVGEDGKKIGHWGVGDYLSVIEREEEIEKTIPLIEKVYNLKVK